MNRIHLQALMALGQNHSSFKALPEQIDGTWDGNQVAFSRDELLEKQIFLKEMKKYVPSSKVDVPEALADALEQIYEEWERNANIELLLSEKFQPKSAAEFVTWYLAYKDISIPITRYPELYPSICFEKVDGLCHDCVIPIGLRRYRVTYVSPISDYQENKGKLTLTETFDPVSEFTVCPLSANKDWLSPTPNRPRHGVYWFGQPSFIQNEVFPSYKGKAASLLFCFESGWGDCGNENVFIALDDNGRPVQGWVEYSCA